MDLTSNVLARPGPPEFEVKNLRDGFHEQRLGEARRAGDEAMSSREQGEQNLLYDFLLAHDDFGQFGFDARASGDEFFDGLGVGGRYVRCDFHSAFRC